ncbi:MAG: hypothetical protein M1817_000774 [Caeruleum heppii]|nr:MAG: hypothetical protein M1817_000774 [Caeruleum heppii]
MPLVANAARAPPHSNSTSSWLVLGAEPRETGKLLRSTIPPQGCSKSPSCQGRCSSREVRFDLAQPALHDRYLSSEEEACSSTDESGDNTSQLGDSPVAYAGSKPDDWPLVGIAITTQTARAVRLVTPGHAKLVSIPPPTSVPRQRRPSSCILVDRSSECRVKVPARRSADVERSADIRRSITKAFVNDVIYPAHPGVRPLYPRREVRREARRATLTPRPVDALITVTSDIYVSTSTVRKSSRSGYNPNYWPSPVEKVSTELRPWEICVTPSPNATSPSRLRGLAQTLTPTKSPRAKPQKRYSQRSERTRPASKRVSNGRLSSKALDRGNTRLGRELTDMNDRIGC